MNYTGYGPSQNLGFLGRPYLLQNGGLPGPQSQNQISPQDQSQLQPQYGPATPQPTQAPSWLQDNNSPSNQTTAPVSSAQTQALSSMMGAGQTSNSANYSPVYAALGSSLGSAASAYSGNSNSAPAKTAGISAGSANSAPKAVPGLPSPINPVAPNKITNAATISANRMPSRNPPLPGVR